jgi:hypothetical protein
MAVVNVGDIVCEHTVTRFESIEFTVDHEARLVKILSYKNSGVRIHVFNQHDTDAHLMELNYHYPGLACSIPLPKISNMKKVRLMVFDDEHRLHLVEEKLHEKLFFTHHHYAKYYLYGLVPIVMKNFKQNLYIGAPVFDVTNKVMLSVVCDCYFPRNDYCVIPITGEMSGTSGIMCLDGNVWLSEVGDNFDYSNTDVMNRIDIYVSFDKKYVYINQIYNNSILNCVRVKSKFVGNVLIR